MAVAGSLILGSGRDGCLLRDSGLSTRSIIGVVIPASQHPQRRDTCRNGQSGREGRCNSVLHTLCPLVNTITAVVHHWMQRHSC